MEARNCVGDTAKSFIKKSNECSPTLNGEPVENNRQPTEEGSRDARNTRKLHLRRSGITSSYNKRHVGSLLKRKEQLFSKKEPFFFETEHFSQLQWNKILIKKLHLRYYHWKSTWKGVSRKNCRQIAKFDERVVRQSFSFVFLWEEWLSLSNFQIIIINNKENYL